MKNILRIIVLGAIVIGLAILVIDGASFLLSEDPKPYTDSGKIVEKSNKDVVIKHGVNTELYLCVEFEKRGFKAVNVDATTYFKYKVGDIFSCEVTNRAIITLRQVLGIGILGTIAILTLILFLLWLMPDSVWK